MTDTKKTVTEFSISWTADHNQYWQGHGIAFLEDYESATGIGDTLMDAFEDAIDGLYEQDIDITDEQRDEMLDSLASQVKESRMLKWDIVKVECSARGNHAEQNLDCAVCAGEWNFYVSIDVFNNAGETCNSSNGVVLGRMGF